MTNGLIRPFKIALSFLDQVRLLEDRKLTIIDKVECERILSRVNYYKLSGYSLHNIDTYGELPIWVAVEILSFGSISKLFRNLRKADQKAIVKSVTESPKAINADCVASWFMSIVNLRNRCAHHGRLFNKSMTSEMSFLNAHEKYFEEKGLIVNKDSLFALIFVTKELVSNKKQWGRLMIALVDLIGEYEDVIDVSKMGFPLEWLELLL